MNRLYPLASDLFDMLAHRAEELCHELLPNGRCKGDEWRVGSVGGELGKRLGVHLAGPKAGVWCDFVTEP